ncbi:hypothetical protein JTE90_010455 [Oedothorax gibbosus]|uniref:Uncharacterized protein n=1 Tax=Oedothorax gibbosus TaxID=931172 RepID=A0AAV6W2N1_9ARAC|nr:hypothetical protein JTE90_010455 [Oedothorax gibbosus]
MSNAKNAFYPVQVQRRALPSRGATSRLARVSRSKLSCAYPAAVVTVTEAQSKRFSLPRFGSCTNGLRTARFDSCNLTSDWDSAQD